MEDDKMMNEEETIETYEYDEKSSIGEKLGKAGIVALGVVGAIAIGKHAKSGASKLMNKFQFPKPKLVDDEVEEEDKAEDTSNEK